jgi:hypothetical protein
MDPAVVALGLSVILGPVGVGGLGPVRQRPEEVPVPHPAGLLHERRLVSVEQLRADPAAHRSQRLHVRLADVARQPRRLGGPHGPQRAPEADPPAGGRDGGAAADRDPRRRRAGPVGLPRSFGVEGGGGPGGHRVEPLELAVQRLDRLTVGERRRLDGAQRVDSGGKILQHISPRCGGA